MINAETVRRGDTEIIENVLSEQVLDAGIEVHRTFRWSRTVRKLI